MSEGKQEKVLEVSQEELEYRQLIKIQELRSLVILLLSNHLLLLIVVFLLALGVLIKFSALGIVLACLVAVVITGVLAMLVVWGGYRFGKVSGDKEMELYSDLNFLGVLPDSRQSFNSNDKENNIYFESICKHFQNTGVEHHVVMAGMLPGADIKQSFFDSFCLNYALVGKEVLIVDVIDANDFKDEEPMSDTYLVFYKNSMGVLPLDNHENIAENELLLLKEDLKILRKKYDLIIIRQIHPFANSLFMEKISSVCDGMLIGVGAKSTKRRSLRYLGRLALKNNCQIMTVLSGLKKIDNHVTGFKF